MKISAWRACWLAGDLVEGQRTAFGMALPADAESLAKVRNWRKIVFETPIAAWRRILSQNGVRSTGFSPVAGKGESGKPLRGGYWRPRKFRLATQDQTRRAALRRLGRDTAMWTGRSHRRQDLPLLIAWASELAISRKPFRRKTYRSSERSTEGARRVKTHGQSNLSDGLCSAGKFVFRQGDSPVRQVFNRTEPHHRPKPSRKRRSRDTGESCKFCHRPCASDFVMHR